VSGTGGVGADEEHNVVVADGGTGEKAVAGTAGVGAPSRTLGMPSRSMGLVR